MKKVKMITIVLAILLIIAVAFAGIYIQKQGDMVNLIRRNVYTNDFNGIRYVRLSLDTSTDTTIKDADGNEVTDADELTDEELAEKGYTKEEKPANTDEVKTLENYKTAKKVIENRLNALNTTEYKVRLDETTGDIVIELPENDSTDTIVGELDSMGKFEIQDSETGEVLIGSNDIESANVLFANGSSSASTSSGTNVYLSIQFTNEGAKKLEQISTEYVKTDDTDETESASLEETNTTSEGETTSEETNTTSDEETTFEVTTTEGTEPTEEPTEEPKEDTKKDKQVTIKMDDTEMLTTGFEEPLRTGAIQLQVGQASTENDEIQENAERASLMSVIISSGEMKTKYEVSGNEYILPDITEQDRIVIAGAVAVGVAVLLLTLILRYKVQGLLAVLAYMGQAALFALLIKYTNTILSIEGIVGIAISLVLNYMFVDKLLSKLKNEELSKENIDISSKETYKEFFMNIIPVCIFAIVTCFAKWAPFSSFGTVMFWGITLIAVYNFIVTKNILKLKAEK